MAILTKRDTIPLAGTIHIMVILVLMMMTRFIHTVPGIAMLAPWLAAGAIFFWALFRPSMVPFVMVFMLGCVEDGLAGTPFGLHAFGLLTLCYFTQMQSQHLLQRPFAVIWISFAVMLLLTQVLMMLLLWLAGQETSWWVLLSWAASAVCFPLVYAFMAYVKSRLVVEG